MNLRQTSSLEIVAAQVSSLASLSKLLKNSSRHDSNDAEENLVNYFSIDNFQFIFITSNLISSIRKKIPSPSFSFMRKAIKFLITGGLKRQSVSGIGIYVYFCTEIDFRLICLEHQKGSLNILQEYRAY